MHIKRFQEIVDKIRCKDLRRNQKLFSAQIQELKNQIIKLQKKEKAANNITCKIDTFINGTNNQIYSINNNDKFNIIEIPKTTNFKIQGDNNKIIFHRTHGKMQLLPSGLNIKIIGNNNTIIIHEPNFSQSKIYIEKDNNLLNIKKTKKFVENAYFVVEQGASIIIEENCEIGNGKLRLFANGDYINKHKIVIGSGTHIAHDSIIRNSDGECLIDSYGNALSEPKDIIIGKNCWITSRCTILKGTILPNNTIVASCSLVNKEFKEKNTLIGGIPAKILRHDVHWVPMNYGKYMESLESKHHEV